MARLQTQSVRAMRPMLEEAQQTLPKSVDNGVLNSLNYITKAGAGLAAAAARGVPAAVRHLPPAAP